METPSILSMPEQQYRAAAGVSKSDLDWICPPRTPAHFRARKDGIIADEETPARRMGSLVHRAILEPHTLADAIAEKPDGLSLATKEGRAWKESHADRVILSADEAGAMRAMSRAVWNHPMAGRLLTGAAMEQCLFATDSHGTIRKGRLDVLPPRGNVIADIKTCASADRDEFERSVGKYRYHVQAAYYLDLCNLVGREFENFAFTCVEKSAPFCVAVYALEKEAIDAGRDEYRRDLALVRHCEAEGHWPGFGDGIGSIGLPAWLQKQVEAAL